MKRNIKWIEVESEALESLKAMAQRLQDERDELLEAIKGCSTAFRSIVNNIPDAKGYSRKCADAVDEVIAKCTAKPEVLE